MPGLALSAALVFIGALGVVGLVRDWRQPVGSSRFDAPAYWVFSANLWSGVRRTTAVAEFGVLCLVFGTLIPGAEVVLGGVFFLVAIPMCAIVYAFNWPKQLVPPALRDQPGALNVHRRS